MVLFLLLYIYIHIFFKCDIKICKYIGVFTDLSYQPPIVSGTLPTRIMSKELHILEFLLNLNSFPKRGFINTVDRLKALESTWMEAPLRQRHCLSWTLLYLQCRVYCLHLTNTD